MTQELKTAAERLAEAKRTLAELEAKAAALPPPPSADELAAARARLEELAAAAALGEVPQTQAAASGRDLEKLQAAAQTAAAAAAGLRRRVEAATEAVAGAVQALRDGESAWLQAALADADLEYSRLAQPLAAAFARCSAIGSMLRMRGHHSVIVADGLRLPPAGPRSAGIADREWSPASRPFAAVFLGRVDDAAEQRAVEAELAQAAQPAKAPSIGARLKTALRAA